MVEPVIDKIVENTDQVSQCKNHQLKQDSLIDELKETVYQTSGKLDVFEQINIKIANIEAERKILEDKVDY